MREKTKDKILRGLQYHFVFLFLVETISFYLFNRFK